MLEFSDEEIKNIILILIRKLNNSKKPNNTKNNKYTVRYKFNNI